MYDDALLSVAEAALELYDVLRANIVKGKSDFAQGVIQQAVDLPLDRVIHSGSRGYGCQCQYDAQSNEEPGLN